MQNRSFTFRAADGKEIFVHFWMPEIAVKAIVLVAHGMAEHGDRYERLASVLTAAGYAVYAPDLRGHGKTASTEAELGYFADTDGFFRVTDDIRELANRITADHSGRKLFLIGHSMGSLVARAYIAMYGEGLSGCLLSGTVDGGGALMVSIGLFLARIGCLVKGPHAKAPLLDRLSFGSYNAAFRPNRTKFDWLSRDRAEVDKYVADPRCGFICTEAFFRDLASGVAFVLRSASAIPKSLPILLCSGSRDPAGAAHGVVDRLYDEYRALGLRDVQKKLYGDARHEIFNEINRDEVMADVLAWLERH